MAGGATSSNLILASFTKLKSRKTKNQNDRNKTKVIMKVLIKARRYLDKEKQKVCIGKYANYIQPKGEMKR